MNPYYDAEKLGFKMLSFEEDLGCEYNTLLFLANEKGQVFTASDMGCSCPTPFEDYEGDTQVEVEQKLERIGSLAQAKQIFNTWNKGYTLKGPLVNGMELEFELERFFNAHFKR